MVHNQNVNVDADADADEPIATSITPPYMTMLSLFDMSDASSRAAG